VSLDLDPKDHIYSKTIAGMVFFIVEKQGLDGGMRLYLRYELPLMQAKTENNWLN
jgi:hypothetical protein